MQPLLEIQEVISPSSVHKAQLIQLTFAWG